MPDPQLAQPDLWGWLATAGGVIGTVVLAMVRGWLVPGRQVDRLVAVYREVIVDKDRQIADWKETARTEAQRGDLLAAGQDKILASQEALLKSLASGGER